MKRMDKYIAFMLLLINCTEANKETNSVVETKQVYQTKQFGFSQAVIANGLIFISGQVGWDSNHELTENQSFTAQLKQTFSNIKKILEKCNNNPHLCQRFR